jgi:hypothetical protein
MRLNSVLRVCALAVVLCFASLSAGHAVSDTGTCWTYCYDANNNLVASYQTQNEFDYCCGNQDSLCGTAHPRSHWSAKYYYSEGDC